MELTNVYIVDDSKVQGAYAVQLVGEALSHSEIRYEQNPLKTLAELRARPADIAIVDLEMPGLDGIDLISHIAREKLVSALIILSSRPLSLQGSVVTMAESQGMDVLSAIQKPLTFEKLSAAFEKFAPKKSLSKIQSRWREPSLHELKNGLVNNQFLNYYQPKIRIHDNAITGVEALARWKPENEIISPYAFIDKMEKGGLIDSLAYTLFDEAMIDVSKLNKEFTLSVNLSPVTLLNTNLPNWVEQRVGIFGAKPENIIFEITETALIMDLAKSLHTLSRLRLKGFQIAIDDYGTGYANAEQLSHIPATILKIDRNLVDGASRKDKKRKILESTVSLAKDLNLYTVAEGVEESDDLELVTSLGVDEVQGFIFSKPLALHDLENFITCWKGS